MEGVPFIEWCLENLNYLTIALLMMIESSFIPFPSEIVIPPAAYMAASTGELNFYLVVLFGTLGAICGALINYGLAYALGRPIVHRFARSRIGGFLLLSEDGLVKAEQYFVEHGKVSTLIGRLVPGIRQLISIPAGLSKMKLSTFIIFTALGAGVWNIVLAAIGWYAESVVPRDELMSYVYHYSKPIGYAILGIVSIVLIYMTVRALRRPKVKVVDDNIK
ncbi:DedA family protein [Porphyromonadaceae bacterium W3.11]|nr:DedA family protein [Porphyromonadaceae bacterium W3.11]